MSVWGACYANGRLIVDCDHECMFNPKSDCNFCGMNTPEAKLRNIPDFKDYIERDYSRFPNYTIERFMVQNGKL